MISVVFYQFEKRTNSTKLPDVSGVTFNCEINANCSMVSPRIEINYVGTGRAGNPTLYNYCYISDFTRYYFVRNWTWAPGKWIAELSEDVLASYRTQILNSTEYVTRAAAAYNVDIVDTTYPTEAGVSVTRNTGTNQFSSDIQSGSYILGTVTDFAGGSGSGFGSNLFYNLNSAAFGRLRMALLQNTDYLDISAEEISSSLTKALLNPYQYLTSCMFYPFAWPKDTAYDFNDIGVGWWSLSLGTNTANVISSGYDTAAFIQQFTLPKHPQASTRGNWLNLEPYTRYTLFVPPFGEIPLPGNAIVDASSIWYKIIVDAYTGQGLITVTAGQPSSDTAGIGDNTVAMRSAQVGVPVSLAQIAYNPVDSLGELVGLGATALYGATQGLFQSASQNAGFFDTFDNVVNGIGDAVSHDTSTAQYKGSCGAVAIYDQSPYLEAKFTSLVDDDNTHRGKPLCELRQLSTLPGFVKCADSDIAIAGTQAEADQIKTYMSNGFYVE